MDVWLKPWMHLFHNLVNFMFEDIFIFYVTNMFVSSANKTLSASWMLIEDHLCITKIHKKYMYSVQNSYYHSTFFQQTFSVWLKWTKPWFFCSTYKILWFIIYAFINIPIILQGVIYYCLLISLSWKNSGPPLIYYLLTYKI